jgi:hypothetical protein
MLQDAGGAPPPPTALLTKRNHDHSVRLALARQIRRPVGQTPFTGANGRAFSLFTHLSFLHTWILPAISSLLSCVM